MAGWKRFIKEEKGVNFAYFEEELMVAENQLCSNFTWDFLSRNAIGTLLNTSKFQSIFLSLL